MALQVRPPAGHSVRQFTTHVFERFWREDTSRSRKTEGSGLGLSIVRQLVRAHGGEVFARSHPGIETVFTIRLPHGTSPTDWP